MEGDLFLLYGGEHTTTELADLSRRTAFERSWQDFGMWSALRSG
jgi:hypothetical protein